MVSILILLKIKVLNKSEQLTHGADKNQAGGTFPFTLEKGDSRRDASIPKREEKAMRIRFVISYQR